MKKIYMLCFLCALVFQSNAHAKKNINGLDFLVGTKWQALEYMDSNGCDDEDGQYYAYINREKGNIHVDMYEAHFVVLSVKQLYWVRDTGKFRVKLKAIGGEPEKGKVFSMVFEAIGPFLKINGRDYNFCKT